VPLFFRFAFLAIAFPPEDKLSGWPKMAVKTNPVPYVMEALRAMVLDGWEWGTILTGVWVAGVEMGVLVVVATWLYRKRTA